MKICFLITAYKDIDQLIRLVHLLGVKNGYENTFIHIDKKSDIIPSYLKLMTDENLNVIKKFNVYWGGFNQLQSIISLIDIARKKKKYDSYILLSGQDLPIKPYSYLTKYLSENKNTCFITSQSIPFEEWNYKGGLGRIEWFWFLDYLHIRGTHRLHLITHYIFEKFNLIKKSTRNIRFYGGSDWWILPGEVAEYCLKQFIDNKKLRGCFKYSFIPSEMFFQTVISNSIYKSKIAHDNKRFIKWGKSKSGHPDILMGEDKKNLIASNALFARKFDMSKDLSFFNEITEIF